MPACHPTDLWCLRFKDGFPDSAVTNDDCTRLALWSAAFDMLLWGCDEQKKVVSDKEKEEIARREAARARVAARTNSTFGY